MFLDVILRSPADGGTTKNLEILRPAQDDSSSLREGCPELAEELRMALGSFRTDSNSVTLSDTICVMWDVRLFPSEKVHYPGPDSHIPHLISILRSLRQISET